MKRRHYRIHYTDHATPLRRIKRKQISWKNIFLVLIALAIVAVIIFVVLKWTELGGTEGLIQQ